MVEGGDIFRGIVPLEGLVAFLWGGRAGTVVGGEGFSGVPCLGYFAYWAGGAL